MKNGLRRFFPFGALPCIVGLLVISGGIRLGAIGLAVANEATNPTVQSVSEELQCPSNPDKEKLLLEISERMAALDAYETELSKREERLNAAKVLVQNNLRNLVAAEEKLANTIARVDGASEEDLARLTSVYESMKPKVAASLFEQMEPSFAAGFLGRMNPQAAAGIMSSLSTEAGYAISVVLAGRNALAPKE